jgi:hypothetical protein
VESILQRHCPWPPFLKRQAFTFFGLVFGFSRQFPVTYWQVVISFCQDLISLARHPYWIPYFLTGFHFFLSGLCLHLVDNHPGDIKLLIIGAYLSIQPCCCSQRHYSVVECNHCKTAGVQSICKVVSALNALHHEDMWRSRYIDQHFLDLGTNWR